MIIYIAGIVAVTTFIFYYWRKLLIQHEIPLTTAHIVGGLVYGIFAGTVLSAFGFAIAQLF